MNEKEKSPFNFEDMLSSHKKHVAEDAQYEQEINTAANVSCDKLPTNIESL